MPTGELDPDNPNVVEYGPTDETGTEIDVSGRESIDVELFGAAGGSTSESDGAAGGRVIGREYDVSDRSEITLVVADGRIGELNGGESFGGDGGGLTAVSRSGEIDLAAHGGGGGYRDDSVVAGGGGGAAGGDGGVGEDSAGDDGESGPQVADLGGDGGSKSDDFVDIDPTPGSGEVVTEARVDSGDVFEGGGRSIHQGLARIKFTPKTSVTITETNSPIPVGDEVEVDVDVTNEEAEEAQVTVELEVEPA